MEKKADLAWGNQDNNRFYDHIDTAFFHNVIKTGGIDTHIDLKHIESVLKQAQSILEVGAGSGRVLDYLCQHHANKSLHAIERNQAFYQRLHAKYSASATLHQIDIMQFHSDLRFDAILLMFSTIAEFTPQEQVQLMLKFHECLSDGGYLVIDSFLHNSTPINGTKITHQETAIQAKHADLHVYLPLRHELISIAEDAGFTVAQSLRYETTEKRGRYSMVFQCQKK